ncbi:MAG TPA: glycosyltransferase family 4 protein [Steroidobacteraceae bacterium]|jgi:glycosyltransferase involved in cell wall biosynthesis
MKVVVINETFSPKMGYLGTMLPKYLARAGLDVHVIATDLAAYYNLNEFKSGVPGFLQEQTLQAGTVMQIDGYTAHILPHGRALGHVLMRGLAAKLHVLRPDVVYSVLAIGWMPLEAALVKCVSGYRLFTGSHTSALMFAGDGTRPRGALARARDFCVRWLPGRFVSLFSERCYCPTADCGEVAWKRFGVQRSKIDIVHLGIDPEFFHPISGAAERELRAELRRRLGFHPSDIVCIYTGKMTEGKNVILLARAVEQLRSEGRPFRALFVGDGNQRAAVENQTGCVVLDFMPFSQLGDYYRASDVAVWLTNESTSMLDAAACGIPIVVSDRIYQDHVTGNGLAYRMNDLGSLCEQLRMLENSRLRARLGAAGARKMRDSFSWELAAQRRVRDFTAALGRQPRS